MLKRLLCVALVVGAGLTSLAMAQPSAVAGPDDDQRIADLVKKLGSMNYAEREKAKKDLESIGMGALEQLRLAAKTGDVEIRTRCEKLVEKLEAKLAADKLLAPKKVRLNVNDVTVAAAIEELQKISGYPIFVDGDRAPLTKRMITLDTGTVTFWEAFDQLCEKGNLTHVADVARVNTPIRRTPVPLPAPVPVPANPPGQVPPPPGGAAPAKAGQGAQQKMLPMQIQVEVPAAGGEGPVVVVVPVQVGQAQPAPVPVQVQGQVQILPAKGIQPRQPSYPAASLVVRDGAFAKVPTCYSGAVRIRLLPQATEIALQPRQQDEALYVLEAYAEPRLQMFAVTSNPSLQIAVDDLGQNLAVAMEPMPDANGNGGVPVIYYANRMVHHAALRLKQGPKKGSELTELKGTITVESLTPEAEALVTVPNLDKALGQKFEASKGGSIEVRSFQKQADGTYKVQLTFQTPVPFYPANPPAPGKVGAVGAVQPVPPGGAAVPARPVAPAGGAQPLPGGGAVGRPGVTTPVNLANVARMYPQLVDAAGKALTLEQIPQSMGRGVEGVELTMIFRAGEGVGEPTQAILFGHRKVTAEVPFAFKHIPLQ